MRRAANAIELAMGYTSAPTFAQLKRFVVDNSKPIELRKIALVQVTLSTRQKVTWLRAVADWPDCPMELRECALHWIDAVKLGRGGRALARRYGLW
jgi:hypothetical protein